MAGAPFPLLLTRRCGCGTWELEHAFSLEGHSFAVNAVAATPDGRRAVSASDDTTLRVWDLETGRSLFSLKGHSGEVNAIAVTSDGRRAVSASDDRTLRVWDLESGTSLFSLEGHSGPVYAMAVTPDGRRAVSASWDKTLRVWDLESGRPTHIAWTDAVLQCCAFVSNRVIVAGDESGSLCILECETALAPSDQGAVDRTLILSSPPHAPP